MTLRLNFGIMAGLLFSAALHGQAVDEYQVKAAFLYNFAKFVEWPPQTFRAPGDPIAICILGKNPFGETLTEAVKGKTIGGKPFVVRLLPDSQQANTCQILFISSSERKRLHSIFSGIKTAGILTVGETDNFTSEGGIFNFKIEDASVRIQVNLDAANQANLHISSKLLSLAQVMRKPE